LYASLNVTPIKKAPSRNDICSFKVFAKKKSAQDRKIECQDSVVRWIIEESIPFREVETKSFRAMGNVIVENESEHDIFKISRSMARRKISRILRKHYTALTGSKYVPYLPSVYEDSIEDYIGEDVDED